jgi:hypothetical protein
MKNKELLLNKFNGYDKHHNIIDIIIDENILKIVILTNNNIKLVWTYGKYYKFSFLKSINNLLASIIS